jgi:SAM-dependent methyltransferase
VGAPVAGGADLGGAEAMSAAGDAAANRAAWTKVNAEYTDGRAAAAWATDEIEWGVWNLPESQVRALSDVNGKDVVELGCGTAYLSAWLAKRGARPVGVDVTPAQLATARRLMAQTGIAFPLVEADAGDTGLPAASFDLAVSEYGASIWVEADRWIAEAARLLRPGGELVFLVNSPLSILCSPDEGPTEERLVRPHAGLGRIEWPNPDDGVNFHHAHGDVIRVLRRHGFEVLDLIELLAPDDARDHAYYDVVPAEWARRWPAEDIWRARKRG